MLAMPVSDVLGNTTFNNSVSRYFNVSTPNWFIRINIRALRLGELFRV